MIALWAHKDTTRPLRFKHTRHHTTNIKSYLALFISVSMLRRTESTTVCMVSPQGTKESAFYLACGDGSESCSNEIYGEDFSAWKHGCQKQT